MQGLQHLNTIIIDMAQYFNNSELQMSACKAIYIIAQHHGNADNHIGAEGSCEAVIAAILKYPADTDIAKWGWYAVSALAQCKPVHNFVNDNNITRLCDAGVCSMIVRVMNKYSNDSNIALQILQTVSSVVWSDSGIRDTLIALGVCDAMQNNLAYAQAYCEAVYSLALDSIDGKQKLVDAGAMDALTDILHWHEMSAHVITVACRALKALVHDSNEYAVRVINADIHTKLVCALNKHINKQGVAVAGCQAIYNLALDDDSHRVKLGDAGACELLAECAKTHSNNTVVLIAAFEAMRQLARHNKTNGDKFNGAKVHISVINAITDHMSNAELVWYGCLVLVTLSCYATTDVSIDMLSTVGNDGACDVLLKVFEEHSDSVDTVECACLIVQNLSASNDTNRVKLGDCGLCEVVVGVLKANASSEVMTAAVCGAIQNLALRNDANSAKLGVAGACELLAEVSKTHSNNTAALIVVYRAMSQLVGSIVANGNELTVAKAHISVVSAITQYMTNADLVEAGCLVLSNLALHRSTKMIMGNDGVCDIPPKVITRYINTTDTLIVQYACNIVRNLAVHYGNSVKLGDAGACEVIVLALGQHTRSAAVAFSGCYAIYQLNGNCANRDKLEAAGVHSVINSVIRDHAGNQLVLEAAQLALAELSS
jgi:hypothetical protein